MPAQKMIEIKFLPDGDSTFVHQVRNFGEDLYREIEEAKLGDVGGLEAVDQATEVMKVRIHHARKISIVRKLVNQLLKEHFLDYRSEVSYL